MSLTASQTLIYKQVSNHLGDTIDVHVDVYPPTSTIFNQSSSVPAVIYFHGGGLSVGNRKSWFPTWLYQRVTSAGFAFFSADYQLLPPATGHDIAQDVQDILRFVASQEYSADAFDVDATQRNNFKFWVDEDAIAVAGTSAGGLCAYLAAQIDSPKPKAIVSMYGMGGDFVSPHYLSVKTKPFFRGREILDPRAFSEYLHPVHNPDAVSEANDALNPHTFESLPLVSGSPLAYNAKTGFPENRRMFLTRLYLQLGVWHDYYTGTYEDGGISIPLRSALDRKPAPDASNDEVDKFDESIRKLLPSQHHKLFPHLVVSENWPPTMLVHGTADTGVPVWDSRHMLRQLKARGVEVDYLEVEGQEHSFDYVPNAEELFCDVFDKVAAFIKEHIGGK